jgi:hypothetical protein
MSGTDENNSAEHAPDGVILVADLNSWVLLIILFSPLYLLNGLVDEFDRPLTMSSLIRSRFIQFSSGLLQVP